MPSTERKELTDAELADRGRRLARLGRQIDDLEAEKKEASDDFKKQIKDLETQRKELEGVLIEGVEQRPLPFDEGPAGTVYDPEEVEAEEGVHA